MPQGYLKGIIMEPFLKPEVVFGDKETPPFREADETSATQVNFYHNQNVIGICVLSQDRLPFVGQEIENSDLVVSRIEKGLGTMNVILENKILIEGKDYIIVE